MGSLVTVKVGITLKLTKHVAKYGGQEKIMVDQKWMVGIKRRKGKDRRSTKMWDLEWKGSPEIAQKYASIHHVTPGDDQVNAKIFPEITESATQISIVVPCRLIWILGGSMVEIKSQLWESIYNKTSPIRSILFQIPPPSHHSAALLYILILGDDYHYKST